MRNDLGFIFCTRGFSTVKLTGSCRALCLRPSNDSVTQRATTATVRLTRKLAEEIDGIDLTRYRVGELIALPDQEAKMLVAEGWAELISEEWSRTRGSWGSSSRHCQFRTPLLGNSRY